MEHTMPSTEAMINDREKEREGTPNMGSEFFAFLCFLGRERGFCCRAFLSDCDAAVITRWSDACQLGWDGRWSCSGGTAFSRHHPEDGVDFYLRRAFRRGLFAEIHQISRALWGEANE